MTLTISVRFSTAPRAAPSATAHPATAQSCPARRSTPPISIRRGSAAAANSLAPVARAHGQPPDGEGVSALDTGPTAAEALGSLLALAEPAALLLAEAAGFGLLGKVVLATTLRTAQRALA